MLNTEAIDTSTLELLRSLKSKEYLKGFFLTGETALALYLGHPRSVDIDLFSNFGFDVAQMIENLSQDFPLQLFYSSANTLRGAIGNIETDIIAHRYKYINGPFILDNISILSEEDIVAMKINAIITSGQRIMDFIDKYFLLDKFDISEMVRFYNNKYDQDNDALILKSLKSNTRRPTPDA